MKKRKFKIYLTPAENSIVIQSLNHLRNTMLRENRDTGCLDELLLKAMCAPVKKMYIKFRCLLRCLFFSERVSGFFHAHLLDFPHT